MTAIRIYDGNNYVRLLLEVDHTGLVPRNIWSEVYHTNDVVLWVWDGLGGNARRRAIYPEYKRNRTPPKKDIYAGFDVVEEVLKHSKAIQVRVPGYEGDDVVAALARHYAAQGDTVSIYSNDADMLQLTGEFPDRIFCGARIKDNVPPHLIKYYKVTVGDSSDNIPGIAGFGQKSWDSLNKDCLARFIDDVVAGVEPTVDLELPSRCKVDPDLIRAFWNIVSFLPVPFDEMSKHMTVGTPNYYEADAYLKRFYQ